MSDLEKEIRSLLIPSEIALLESHLASTASRDGAIASLVASKLRAMAKEQTQ
jgi:hypothetical protein